MTAFGKTIVRGVRRCKLRFCPPSLLLAVTLVLARPALAQLSFFRTDYGLDAGNRARAGLVIADLNNDGRLDLAVGAANGAIDVALGNGDGTFRGFRSFIPTGDGVSPALALASAAADFDSDGKIDLVLYAGGTVVILPGRGDGTFGPGRLALSRAFFLPPDPSTQLLEAADLNDDGRPDLVLLNYNSVGPLAVLAAATVLLNNANGTFSSRPAFNLPANEYAIGVTIADFNRDGVPDLAVIGTVYDAFVLAPGVLGHVYVGLGNGDGSFSPPVAVSALSANPFFVAAADLNHDGATDLVIDSGVKLVLLNNGDASFRPVPNTINLCCSNPGSIAVADWTRSGNLGLGIFTEAGPHGVGILEGSGDGTFYSAGTAQLDPQAGMPYQFSSADVNGDGLPDLVALFGGNVSVLLNAGAGAFYVPASAASGIASVAPASIAAIYSHFPFSATQSNDAPPAPLQLAGVIASVRDSAGVTRPAPLFYVSPTQVNLEIPAGTAPGVATVAVGSSGPPVFGLALVRNVVPAIFTAQSSSFQGGAFPAALAVTYGPDNQPQPPLLVTACQSVPLNSCSAVPIPRPAGSRVFLELFATGIRNHGSPVVVLLGGGPAVSQTIAPAYAGAQGQFDGLDQVNVEITNLRTFAGSPSGTMYNLVLNVDGFVSNAVLFAIQ